MPRRLVSIRMVALSLSFLHVRENIHESWECHVAAMLVATHSYCKLDTYALFLLSFESHMREIKMACETQQMNEYYGQLHTLSLHLS